MVGRYREWFYLYFKLLLTACLVFLLPVLNGVAGKTVRVGWYQAPGLQEGTDISSLRGFNYEYLGLMAQYEGWQYEFVFDNFDVLEQQLIQGNVDIIGDVAKTDERLEKYNYCNYPSCYSRLLMVCRWDDERFAYNDYPSFNGIKVAISPSSFRRSMVNRRGAKYNFSVQFLEYPTDEEMLRALDRGEADVAVFSDAMIVGKYKVISKWEPEAQYFIVNKNRPDILKDMNEAMDHIQSSDRFIQERLFKKYFSNHSELITAFSKEEIEYIHSMPVIRVLMHVNDAPISYLEDGQPRGTAIDYLNELIKRTGLSVEYIYCNTFEELQTRLANGDGDIYVHMPDDYIIGRNFSARLTQPYMMVRDGFVTRIGDNTDIKVVAMIEAHPLRKRKLLARNFQVKEYTDTAACLDAVLNHEVDAAVLDNGSYNLISYHAKYQALLYRGDPTLEAGISFGVSDKSPHELYNIVKKVTNDMNQSTLDNISLKNATAKYQYTFSDYVHYSAVFILALVILLVIVVAVVLKSRRQKQFNAKLSVAKEVAEQAKLQADRANEAKSTFLASMSHDLRTPLNGILGYTELALQETRAAHKQDYLNKVKISSRLLLDMVNDTLDLSHIESGKLVLKPEVLDGKQYWEEIVTAMQPVAAVKNIDLRTDFSQYPQKMIRIDRVQVKKILVNIISNAIKYTPDGGTVTVSIKILEPPEKGCTRRIIVEDTGIGMSKEFMTHMFEPFSQEQRPEAANVTGTGLGLAIIHRIVHLMGGTISVESEMHKGTKFIVDLPIESWDKKAEDSLNRTNALCEKVIRNTLMNRRVLLCEDNSINADIAQLLLKNKNMIVDWAKDGQEGVERFSMSEPGFYDAILMDIRMPLLDGIQATSAIRSLSRSDAKDIPIIAMTADIFEETIRETKKIGMNTYVAKPIVPDVLYTTLADQIKMRASGMTSEE